MIAHTEKPRAYWTAQGMSRAVGVPLARAVVEGWITRADLARIVERCGACTAGAACQDWLSRLTPEVPAFCAIKPELDALRAFR
jgi:hypothetical protein